jgi:hypothetical protein
MNTSTSLKTVLDQLTSVARSLSLTDTAWAQRAGLRKETLSRLRRRASCDYATLYALALAVGARVAVVTGPAPGVSDDGHFPLDMPRNYEERLLQLSASRALEPNRWLATGPRFFMAGLAVMLASVDGFDRKGLLTLAEQLHPGASEPAAFTQWLKCSPLRPTRFLPMLDMEMKHAA